MLGGLDPDAARREQASDDLRKPEPLRDAETDAGLRLAPNPAPAGEAPGDAEHAFARGRRDQDGSQVLVWKL